MKHLMININNSKIYVMPSTKCRIRLSFEALVEMVDKYDHTINLKPISNMFFFRSTQFRRRYRVAT